MSKLVLIRHGQSLWNLHNLFTGWVDVPLSEKGINEAMAAGETLKNMKFDVVYVSTLIRAIQTAMIVLAKSTSGRVPVILHEKSGDANLNKIAQWSEIYGEGAKLNTLPVHSAWQLNERYYGELQGMDKDETRKKYGEEQVHIWRRSYDVPPPQGESLKLTAERTIPYFESEIVPRLEKGENVFIAAHGNSLRSIVMYIDKLNEEQVLKLEIATGDPIQYEFENKQFNRKKF